jgi:hypothetical protein
MTSIPVDKGGVERSQGTAGHIASFHPCFNTLLDTRLIVPLGIVPHVLSGDSAVRKKPWLEDFFV